jgi:hypothetical protein
MVLGYAVKPGLTAHVKMAGADTVRLLQVVVGRNGTTPEILHPGGGVPKQLDSGLLSGL